MSASEIEVEVKVVGTFGADSLALAERIRLKPGAQVIEAIEAVYRAGAIAKPVFEAIKKLRPPLFLVINDEKIEGKGMKVELADGDSVTVMQIMAGG